MDEKIKNDIEEEKKENLDRTPKIAVPLKLNKKWVVALGTVFILFFAYNFIKASTPVESKKPEHQESETYSSLDTTSFNNNDILIEQEKKKKQLTETTQLVEKVEKPKAEIQRNDTLDKYLIEQLEIEKEIIRGYYSQLLQEEQDARTSAMTFKNINSNSNNNNSSMNVGNNTNMSNSQGAAFGAKDQNGQVDKKKFLKEENPSRYYNNHTEMYPISPYEIKAGSIIPGVMITATISDLPGEMIGQVRENVYDTVTGNTLLIPKGTRILGKYDSSVTFGQERILVIWQRLVFPNGKSIGLDNMPGTDLSGYAGFKGKVNNHYFKLLQAVVLSSFMGAGEAIITRDKYGEDDWRHEAGTGGGEVAIEFGNKMAERILDQQPSMDVPMAYTFNIIVNSDLVLTPYEE